MGIQMMMPEIRSMLNQKLREFGKQLSRYVSRSFYVDGDKIANAFRFNMTQEELQRLMMALGENVLGECEGFRVSYKPQVRKSFDYKAFHKAYPGVNLDPYFKETRFRVLKITQDKLQESEG